MNTGGYIFDSHACPKCGRRIKLNWYIKHLRAKCKKG